MCTCIIHVCHMAWTTMNCESDNDVVAVTTYQQLGDPGDLSCMLRNPPVGLMLMSSSMLIRPMEDRDWRFFRHSSKAREKAHLNHLTLHWRCILSRFEPQWGRCCSQRPFALRSIMEICFIWYKEYSLKSIFKQPTQRDVFQVYDSTQRSCIFNIQMI